MTKFVLKHPGAPAVSVFMPSGQDQVTYLQAIVEGHIKVTSIQSNGLDRIVFVMNDKPKELEQNIQFGSTKNEWIHGPVAIARFGGKGKMVSMTEEEVTAWIEFADQAAQPKKETEEAKAPAAPPISAEGISIVVVPKEEVATPESTVDGVMSEVGVDYEHVPVSQKAVYASALEALRGQGHEFEILDQEQFLLNIKGRDGV